MSAKSGLQRPQRHPALRPIRRHARSAPASNTIHPDGSSITSIDRAGRRDRPGGGRHPVQGPGGGGYGDPLDRNLDHLQHDLDIGRSLAGKRAPRRTAPSWTRPAALHRPCYASQPRPAQSGAKTGPDLHRREDGSRSRAGRSDRGHGRKDTVKGGARSKKKTYPLEWMPARSRSSSVAWSWAIFVFLRVSGRTMNGRRFFVRRRQGAMIVALDKVRAALEEGGSSMDHIVKTVMYLKDRETTTSCGPPSRSTTRSTPWGLLQRTLPALSCSRCRSAPGHAGGDRCGGRLKELTSHRLDMLEPRRT